MARITFGKYEGLGNDFVVVDAADVGLVTPRLARSMCERHRGVGADGVILVLPSDRARAKMVVLNADGSRPEMCGNGLRCVALHVSLADGSSGGRLVIDADAGLLACDVERAGVEASVSADVGRGRSDGALEATFGGSRHELAKVSMGNPHAILFDSDYDETAIDRFAPEVSAAVEGGSNVEFANVTDDGIDLVVWERGVGRTLACGTGAAATAVAAALAGRTPFGEPVEVRLPGGPLSVTVDRDTLAVRMRGPARRVFVGEIDVP